MKWFLRLFISSVLLVHCTKLCTGQNLTATRKPELPRTNTTLKANNAIKLTTAAGSSNKSSTTTTAIPIVSNSNVNGDRVRIVGGEETAEHEFPFIVSLSKQGAHFCGATIIHKEWIITAAHCLHGSDFQIKAGEHNIENAEGTEQLVLPKEVVIYPTYNATTFENDIALIRVTPAFQFNGTVKAFLLPLRNFVPRGYVTTAGWGTTSEGSHLTSPVLRKVSVPVVENIECGKQYGGNFDLLTMLCAGESEGNKDSCQGDSGGPLMCTHLVQRPGVSTFQNETVLCGIVSYGYGCARKSFAGVYTRVTAYMDWIEKYLYGEEFISANKDRSTPKPIAVTTRKAPRKPFNPNPKSSADNIHTMTANKYLFHIITLCVMYGLTKLVIVKF